MKNSIISVFLFIVYTLIVFANPTQAAEIPVVAVWDFKADGVSQRTAFLCSDYLRKELADKGRVIIREREEMDNMLDQVGENLEECTEEGCAFRLGKWLDVDKMITGKVSKTGTRYIVMTKYLDLESAKIDFQEDITVEGIEEDKLTDYISSLADKIAARVVLLGSVIEVSDEILLDIGKSVGIKAGDRFKVKR